MSVQDKLADELNIDPLIEAMDPSNTASANTASVNSAPANSVPVPASDNPDDFEFARENLRLMIKMGLISMADLKSIALQSSSVYAYETFATLMKSLADTNIDLMVLAEKNKKLKDPTSGGNQLIPISGNNVFIGDTFQLQQLLKDKGLLTITDVEFPEEEAKIVNPVPESEKNKRPITAEPVEEPPVTEPVSE